MTTQKHKGTVLLKHKGTVQHSGDGSYCVSENVDMMQENNTEEPSPCVWLLAFIYMLCLHADAQQ